MNNKDYLKNILNFTILLGVILICGSLNAQKRIITEISFKENQIVLNNKKAFDYQKNGNAFTISDLNGNSLIIGEISETENGEWQSVIEFLTIDKKFSNRKIIGRNDLIFALANSNVIEKNFELNKKKLLAFIIKNNELK